jgi:hypothetical protein
MTLMLNGMFRSPPSVISSIIHIRPSRYWPGNQSQSAAVANTKIDKITIFMTVRFIDDCLLQGWLYFSIFGAELLRDYLNRDLQRNPEAV